MTSVKIVDLLRLPRIKTWLAGGTDGPVAGKARPQTHGVRSVAAAEASLGQFRCSRRFGTTCCLALPRNEPRRRPDRAFVDQYDRLSPIRISTPEIKIQNPRPSVAGKIGGNANGQIRLKGRKALVTGGARGLGAGMAEALAEAGASVMIGDILGDAGQSTAKAIAGKGVKAGFVPLDVTDEASWEEAVAATISELGGFDILINNAGIEITSLVIDVKADDLARMCAVNIVGTALGMKHAFRAMKPGGAAGKGGAIVSISSVAATIAFPGIAGYSGTKSAVDRMTRIAAMESGKLGYGVRVNCIYPGLVHRFLESTHIMRARQVSTSRYE